MGQRKLISVVTPCYNEEANVENHFKRVCEAIEPFRSKYDFEHIYTDNCSEDETFGHLSAIAHRTGNVRVLRFSRNIGADRAIFFGLQHAKGEAVVLIQADLQDPPEMIPDFIKNWEMGYDVVYGKILNRKEGYVYKALRRVYYKIIAELSDYPVAQNAGEFRLTSRRALDALLQFQEQDLYIRGIVAQVGFAQLPLPYYRQERAKGKTSTNFIFLVGYAINGLLSTTVVPIRAVTILGFFFALFGFFLTFYILLFRFISPTSAPHGFTTLASLITLFSGVQVLSIGIIGEYLKKTYLQSLQRPRGFIQDRVNF